MNTYSGITEYSAALGSHLGHSRWRTVTQKQVDLFADATDDHQWIHTDLDRAQSGPFGTTIAHGFLSLSLIPAFLREIFQVKGLAMIVNYGSDKVRFPSPVPVGSLVRAGAELIGLEQSPQGVRSTVRVTVEIKGSDKPACVAEIISLMRP